MGTVFGREPAFWSGAAGTALTLAVAFGLPLTDEQTVVVVAFVAAAASAAAAFKVRPIEPPVFTGLAQATIALVTGFGLSLTDEQIGALMATVQVVMVLVTVRPQVTPTGSHRADPGG